MNCIPTIGAKGFISSLNHADILYSVSGQGDMMLIRSIWIKTLIKDF